MPAKIDKEKLNFKISDLNTVPDKVAKVSELREAANQAYKELGNDHPSQEELDYVCDLNKKAEEVQHEILISNQFQEQKRRHEEFYGRAGNGGGSGAPAYGGGQAETPKSIGGMFAQSKQFREFVELKGGCFDEGSTRYIGDGVNIEGMQSFTYGKEEKAIVTGASATSAGALVRRDYAPLVDLPWPKLVMRDLVTTLQTSSDLIEYPREVSRTNAAAVTREATSAADSQTATVAGMKPACNMTRQRGEGQANVNRRPDIEWKMEDGQIVVVKVVQRRSRFRISYDLELCEYCGNLEPEAHCPAKLRALRDQLLAGEQNLLS